MMGANMHHAPARSPFSSRDFALRARRAVVEILLLDSTEAFEAKVALVKAIRNVIELGPRAVLEVLPDVSPIIEVSCSDGQSAFVVRRTRQMSLREIALAELAADLLVSSEDYLHARTCKVCTGESTETHDLGAHIRSLVGIDE